MFQQSDKNAHEIHPCSREIRLGVAGCGKHSLQSHLGKIDPSKGVSVIGVYDPSSESIAEMNRTLGVPAEAFADEEALMLSPADAVFVMSPDEFHAGTLRTAVRAGKHVFVEKPLAANSEQLTILGDALTQARERGLVVSSCHARRFDPPFLWLKEELAALTAELGKVLAFEFDFSYHTPSKHWKHNRGLLLDHANHEIDLLHWYFGHDSFSALRLADCADDYQVVGVRDDGIRFSFRGTRMLGVREYREFMMLRFARGALTLDAHDGIVSIHNHESGEKRTIGIESTNYDLRLRRVNANFIDAIRGSAQNYLSERDLYLNTAFCVKLTERQNWRYEIDRTGQPGLHGKPGYEQ